MKKALLLCLFAASCALGDTFFIEDTTGTGLSPDDAIAVLQFVRNQVIQSGHQVVPDRAAAALFLRPKLMRLGKSYVFTLEKRSAATVLFTTQMKAAEVEELDEVVGRVTRAVLDEVPANQDARVDDVTKDEETRGTRRRPARKGSFFAFGPAWLSNVNHDGVGLYLAGAYAWDVNRIMVRLRVDLSLRGGALFTDFGLGASYFLSDRNVAPFVGLDAGFGVARIDQGSFLTNETVTGFTLAPLVGVHLLRTSSINLEVAGRAAFMLTRASTGTPVAFNLRLGLYF